MKHAVRVPLLALGAVALLAAACSREAGAAGPPDAVAERAAAGSLPQLLFFMNPNGRPCQAQDSILRGMGDELKGKVALVYYATTSEQDLAKFEEYGIRALPTLVVADASGRELRRAPPGIQSAEQVRRLVGP